MLFDSRASTMAALLALSIVFPNALLANPWNSLNRMIKVEVDRHLSVFPPDKREMLRSSLTWPCAMPVGKHLRIILEGMGGNIENHDEGVDRLRELKEAAQSGNIFLADASEPFVVIDSTPQLNQFVWGIGDQAVHPLIHLLVTLRTGAFLREDNPKSSEAERTAQNELIESIYQFGMTLASNPEAQSLWDYAKENYSQEFEISESKELFAFLDEIRKSESSEIAYALFSDPKTLSFSPTELARAKLDTALEMASYGIRAWIARTETQGFTGSVYTAPHVDILRSVLQDTVSYTHADAVLRSIADFWLNWAVANNIASVSCRATGVSALSDINVHAVVGYQNITGVFSILFRMSDASGGEISVDINPDISDRSCIRKPVENPNGPGYRFSGQAVINLIDRLKAIRSLPSGPSA